MTRISYKYTVVTARGFVGKGNTPFEACKNANVPTTKRDSIDGTLYFADPLLVDGEIDIDSDTYAPSWDWNDEVEDALSEAICRRLKRRAATLVLKAAGKMYIAKGGKVFITQEF